MISCSSVVKKKLKKWRYDAVRKSERSVDTMDSLFGNEEVLMESVCALEPRGECLL